MSALLSNEYDALAGELQLWREEADPADYWSSLCSNCDACVCTCLAAKFGAGFDPRDIVLKARFGLGDRLLIRESVLWECFRCYRCAERCPEEFKPVEVIARLKEMLREAVKYAPLPGVIARRPAPELVQGE